MNLRWSFRFWVILHLCWILLFGFGAMFVAFKYPQFYLLILWFCLFCLVGILALIRYTERSHRSLGQFLLSIRQQDFSTSYLQQEHLSKEMIQAFQTISTAFKKLRSEKESNFQLLKTVVEHSGVPLIAYDDAGDILLINDATRDLLQIPYLSKIHSLDKVQRGITQKIKDIPNDRRVLLPLKVKDKSYQLSVSKKNMILRGTNISVIALQDIEAELDQKEIESWQRLIRVMTHEIKNSVIPISTLTDVIHNLLKQPDGSNRSPGDLDTEEQEDLRVGIQTIAKRSKGLVNFVSSYNDLTKIPQPHPKPENLNQIINDIVALENQELMQSNIELKIDMPDRDISHALDLQMMEQVLINLLKNAIEALANEDAPRLSIKLSQSKNQIHINISDNGPGMDPETLSQVFIPFFTTKSKGSGIGLPLSRQFVRAQGGQLMIESEPGKGTSVAIVFPI